MKVWHGYGSEHSAKLKMIGKFKNIGDAKRAKETIDQITEQVISEDLVGNQLDRFSDKMLKLLGNLNVNSVSPIELEQFAYDILVDLKDDSIIVSTDEIEISAFLKIMIDKGAKVEVYSRHNYPDPE